MAEGTQIEQAIAALQAHRETVGDSVAEATITALQERLAALHTSSATPFDQRLPKRKQITTLFADVTGFPSLSESREGTNLMDVFRVLWRRLDAAIAEHGGVIDKHIGDGVMGLFGVPVADEDDPERAVWAALAMRTALNDFVDEMSLADSASLHAWRRRFGIRDTRPFRNLQLRVGINTGPVLLGEVGSSDEYTVIGAAVNVASRLEQAAPRGGILISHDTYLLVRGAFEVEPLGPTVIKGKDDPIPVYLVTGAKPHSYHGAGRGVEGIKTQLVGRELEMRQLQRAMMAAVRDGKGQIITIEGETGVGKSRLIREFLDWVRQLNEEIIIFKGRNDQRNRHHPYALVRDLLVSHFGIQDTDPAALVEDKLTRGMAEFLRQDGVDIRPRTYAIGQLIGLSVSMRSLVTAGLTETPQVRNRIASYVEDFFEAAATERPAALIVLEDMQWADDRSIELLGRLSSLCTDTALLMIAITRPQPLGHPWQATGKSSENGEPAGGPEHTVIELAPLTPAESRQLVADILSHVPRLPADLVEMVVARSEGIPFYVEELIKVLIEDGAIKADGPQWRIKESDTGDLRVPPTLTGVLQARLDRLSTAERETLQRAAVVGRIFWDNAVVCMGEEADRPLRAAETLEAIQALERKELVFRRHSSSIGGSQAYTFKNAVLRDVVYESVLLRKRPQYHRVAADWLAKQSGERVAEYSALIAEHYERAGAQISAAELYEIAAGRALEMYDPGVAIDRYCKSLSLLSVEPYHAEWQLRLQEELGKLLRLQARLVEAVQTYMTMQYIARQDGNLEAEAHALIGLAELWREQAAYDKMLTSANRAVQVAWLIGSDEETTRAMLLQSEAAFQLGDGEFALTTAREALERSRRLPTTKETTQSLQLLCRIYIGSGDYKEASRTIELLEKEAAQLETEWELRSQLALQKASLGQLYDGLGSLDKATFCLFGALDLYRELDDQLAIANTLNALGEMIRLRRDAGAAVPLFREAISIAEAIGDTYDALIYRTNLGRALISLAEYDEAAPVLGYVYQFARDIERMSNWAGLPQTCSLLAEAYLGQEELAEALTMALQAHSLALKGKESRVLGMAWRVLGMVAAQLPEQELPIIVNDVACAAADCFTESLRILRQSQGDRMSAYREQALTLWAWSAYEMSVENRRLGIEMREEAAALEEKLRLGVGGVRNHPDSSDG